MNYYIKNATIINEGEIFEGNIYVADGKIAKIIRKGEFFDVGNAATIDATGKYLIPGIIDEHVHFREPGLTAKADIYTESRAAVAGGVTSFMDMPNTIPQTSTLEALQQKFELAAEKSLANYSFYIGATNDNLKEISRIDPTQTCGIKLFMGSSTGNMLVDQDSVLEELFKEAPCLIAAHCEDEEIIKQNTLYYKALAEKGQIVPDASIHPLVRTAEACYKSTAKAVELAEKNGARLHIMHISTKRELGLFRNDIAIERKKITAETCPHYLFFNEEHYKQKGFAIKCNPAIKAKEDQQALLQALTTGLIDTIGTDHAPHLWEEKSTGNYFTSKSGFPSIQHSSGIMVELYRQGHLSLPQLVELMCHNPALLYQIDRRGFIKEGYHADLAIIDPNTTRVIRNEEVLYKCGWVPYHDICLHSQITHTFVNGYLVYENHEFHREHKGEKLRFVR